MTTVRVPETDLRTFTRLALASAIGLGALIVTGGMVRLTGSGLGCPDWPSCARTSFVGALSFHKDIEFGNRLLSTAVSILVVVTVLAALRLRPRRSDLLFPALSLAGGMVAQIVLGGLVVLFHLWPPLVMVHFLVSEAMVGLAVVVYVRCNEPEGEAIAVVSPAFVALSRTLVSVTGAVLAVGTAVSGAGPHGGSPGAKRLPLPFRSMTEVHSTLASFLIGLVVATLFATWIGNAPAAVTRRAQLLLGAVALQAIIGYAQYVLRVPAGLVALHLACATVVLAAVVRFHLGLFARCRLGPEPDPPAAVESASPGNALATSENALAEPGRRREAQFLL